jgi:PRELI-like family
LEKIENRQKKKKKKTFSSKIERPKKMSEASKTTMLHTFEHNWEAVSLASWMKYPSERRPDVLSVDIISRKFDRKTGQLRARRLVTSRIAFPYWIQKLSPWDLSVNCQAVEDSVVDVKNERMVLTLRNLTFSGLMELTETCTYTPASENSEWTLFRQEAESQSSLVSFFASSVEQWSLEQFRKNAVLGREIMEAAVQHCEREFDSFRRLLDDDAVVAEEIHPLNDSDDQQAS